MTHPTLLIELFTEELPPQSLNRLAEALALQVHNGLGQQQLIDPSQKAQSFATPRRLAVMIPQVASVQAQRWVERKGPSVKAGHNAAGDPTAALLGFSQSCGVSVDNLSIQTDAKGQAYFVHRHLKTGETLTALLPDILDEAIQSLPVAKVMRWGDSPYAFVRPVHGLVILHGHAVVPLTLMGLTAGRHTEGHRFLAHGPLALSAADQYVDEMEKQGHVVVSFAERRQRIAQALSSQAQPHQLLARAELLDEVTALVEWPTVYQGSFDEDFLAIPQDCLILSMQQHQKYFPLGDAQGHLVSRFLLVSNIETSTPQAIIRGNERVLCARLSDARFFFEQDKKIRLEDRLTRLSAVVYHQRLGSMAQRVTRLAQLAGQIATALGLETGSAQQAARLMKADLVTDMVGEFPELQGKMGRDYARLEGLDSLLCEAIGAHYQPRFAGDKLPDSPLGTVLALADKLETLVGIFGIGQIPTGDRDPFGLRRATLGILRLLIEQELPLSLPQLLDWTKASFTHGLLEDEPLTTLSAFIAERLRGYLRERGYDATLIEATLTPLPERLDSLIARLNALQQFRDHPEAQGLASAYKRLHNLLKKAPASPTTPLIPLQEAAEISLEQCFQRLDQPLQGSLAQGDYVGALHQLAQLHDPLVRFFDEILVLCPDPALQQSRLNLLSQLAVLMGRVGDLSCLKTTKD